jgi:single-strand DNA-binding protein
MSSVNKVMLLGRVGKEPVIRQTATGSVVANLSMATSTFSSKDNQKQEYTEWHNIVAFNKAAEVIQSYVKKGDQIFVEGSLQTRKYEKDGIERYSTEIVVGRLVLLGKSGGRDKAEETTSEDYARASGGKAKSFDALEDDIPFS